MSNVASYPETLPAHIAARRMDSTDFLSGIQGGGASYPTIGLKGTRFVVKKDGGEVVLTKNEITVVMLGAKPNITKSFYSTKYDPNSTESRGPDCFSSNGATPDAESPLVQHPNCAACPHNQFGSGKDAAGNPSKGKACSDYKMLAVYAAGGVYGFRVPAASLKAFRTYVVEHGAHLSVTKTIIGFDPNFQYAVLTFSFGGFLDVPQCAAMDDLAGTPTMLAITGAEPSAPRIEAPKKAAATPKKAEVVEADVVEDPLSGDAFSLDAPHAGDKKKKSARGATASVTEQPLQVEDAELGDLADALGIKL